LVLVVLLRRRARPYRQRLTHVAEQLLAALIDTHRRAAVVRRPGINLQHIFHVGDEGRVRLGREDPLLLQPRLDLVFLSVRQTVAGSMDSTTSNSTSLSASSFIVQQAWPCGGGEQATATRRAS